MKARLATINLQSNDLDRARAFYVDVLGMVEHTGRSHPPGFIYLSSDGADLTIATPTDATAGKPSDAIELGFEVDDLPAMRLHLEDRCIPDVREESMGWGEAIELRDPDGHRMVLYALRPGV